MGESLADNHHGAKRFIRLYCPKLAADDIDWAAASDPTDSYNCFGFAVGRLVWWQPPGEGGLNAADYWPENVPRDTTVDSYVRAAETEGFIVSPDAAWDESVETIAIYYRTEDREFRHAARQKAPGVWESKLGALSDIEHPANGLDGIAYGSGRIYLRRPRPRPEP